MGPSCPTRDGLTPPPHPHRRGTDYAISKAITIPAWKKKDHVRASDSSCFEISFACREASFICLSFRCLDRLYKYIYIDLRVQYIIYLCFVFVAV